MSAPERTFPTPSGPVISGTRSVGAATGARLDLYHVGSLKPGTVFRGPDCGVGVVLLQIRGGTVCSIDGEAQAIQPITMVEVQGRK